MSVRTDEHFFLTKLRHPDVTPRPPDNFHLFSFFHSAALLYFRHGPFFFTISEGRVNTNVFRFMTSFNLLFYSLVKRLFTRYFCEYSKIDVRLNQTV